jgi:hypothetical protein
MKETINRFKYDHNKFLKLERMRLNKINDM